MLCAVVLTTLTAPITEVRSPGCKIVAKNAVLGALSIVCRHARRTKNIIANLGSDGMGIRAKKTDDGRWVKTIV